jgi:hypothetical protein
MSKKTGRKWLRVAGCGLLVVAAFALASAGVGYAAPETVRNLGLDYWSLPELVAQCDAATQSGAEIDAQLPGITRSIKVRTEVAEQAAAGELSLLEAAVKFREATFDDESYQGSLRKRYPGMSDEERLCRNVLSYVEAAASSSGARRHLARLKAELDDLLKQPGGIRLPA